MHSTHASLAGPKVAAATGAIISGGNQKESAMSELYYLYYATPSPLPRFVMNWIRSNFGGTASGR